MSTEITNQVVQMKFNNREFEKNVQETIASLEKLDQSLQLKDADKGFEKISEAAKDVDLSPLEKATESVKLKFSAFEVVAISALNNITNKAIDAGEKLVKSLSTDNIKDGWNKFEEITRSAGTLVSQGFDMSDVEEQLKRISFFADETSYGLNDIVSNVAKFTSKGTSLTDAVHASEGIALIAAMAGKNANDAARAMTQLSQVSKYVQLMDWRSMETLNMNTIDFQETIIKTAKEAGTLAQTMDGMYQTMSGKKYGTMKELFADGLKEGWFTYDVLIKATSKYASTVDDLYDIVESGEEGINSASDAIAKYGNTLDAVGMKAFKAAQEARTWSDVVNSVKDAVSTQWNMIFQDIFGNYEEATRLFTGLANIFNRIFVNYDRTTMFDEWKEMGGRTALLDGLAAGFYAIKNAVDAVKQAFKDIFYPFLTDEEIVTTKAKRLLSFTEKFREVMYKIANFSARNAKNIAAFFKGIYSVVKLVSDGIVGLFHALIPATSSTGSLFQIVLSLAGAVGKILTYFTDWIRETEILSNVMLVLKGIMSVVGNVFYAIISGLISFGRAVKDVVKYVIKLRPMQYVIDGLATVFAIVAGSVMTLIDNIKELIVVLRSPELAAKSENPVVKVLYWIKNGLVAVGNVAVAVAMKVVEFIKALRQISFKDIFDSISDFFGKANDWILTKVFGETEKEGKNLFDVVKKLAEAFKDLFSQIDLGTYIAGAFIISMVGVAGALAKLMNSASGLFGNASNLFKTVNNWIKKTYAKSVGILNVAEAFGILAASLWLLAKVPAADLTRVAWTVGILIGALTGMYAVIILMTKSLTKGGKVVMIKEVYEGLASIIRAISLSIVAVAGAMLMLNSVDVNFETVKKLGLVLGVVTVLSAIAVGLATLSTKVSEKKFFNTPKIIGMILGILAISLSLRKITQALMDLSKMNLKDIERGVYVLVPMMIAFGALAAGAGQVKLTSVAALFLLIKLMEQVVPELVTLAEQSGSLMNVALDAERLKMILTTLAGVVIFMGVFGKNISKAGTGIALLVASISALMLVMAKLNASGIAILSKETGLALAAIGVLILGIEALSFMTKESKMIAFAGAIAMLVPTLAMMALVTAMMKKLHLSVVDTIPLLALMGGIAIILAMAGETKNAKLGPLLVFFAGLDVLFLTMLALTLVDWEKLRATAISMGIVMGAMAIMMKGMAELNKYSQIGKGKGFIQNLGNIIKKFVSLIFAIAQLAAILVAITHVAKILEELSTYDSKGLKDAAGVLSVMMLVITGLTTWLAKMKTGSGDDFLHTIGIMGAMIIEVIAVGYALKKLAEVPWDDLKGAMIAMNVTLGVLTLSTAILGKIAATPAGIKGLGLGLLVLAVGLGVLCAAMAIAVHIFKDFASALTEIQNAVAGDPIGRVIQQITDGVMVITEHAEEFKQQFVVIGAYIVEGIILGIEENKDAAYQEGVALAQAVLDGTQDAASIDSPSKVMYNNGVFMVAGLCNGLLDNLLLANKSGEALGKSSVAGTIDQSTNAYVAGAVLGGATVEGYDSTVGTMAESAEAASAEASETVVGSIVTIEDEAVATSDKIISKTAEVANAQKDAAVYSMKWYEKAILKFDDWTGRVSAWFGGSGRTLADNIDRGQKIKENLGDMLEDPTGYLTKTAKDIYKSVTEGSGLENFGDALAKIKDELGISDTENYFENILGKDGGAGLLADTAAGLGGVTSAAEKTKSSLASLKDTIEQQMDIFSEFNFETEISAEQMLQNMSSQILGIQGWADNLTLLAARGMDAGLLQKLGDMGPQAYAKVMAFAQMTDEQLQEANNMYQMSLKLPGSAANQVNAGYTYAAEMAMKGFSNALDRYWGLIDPSVIGTKTLEQIEAAMTDYEEPLVKTAGRIGSGVNKTFVDEAPGYEEGANINSDIAEGMESTVGEVKAQVDKTIEELDRLKAYNYDNTGDYDANGHKKYYTTMGNLSSPLRGFASSTDSLKNGAGLSEEMKKKLGFTSDTIDISDDATPKSGQIVMTPVYNLSAIEAQHQALQNTYGTQEVDIISKGVDKRIEASRQMENKILTEAFKSANERTFDKFGEQVVAAIASTEKPVNINVTLQGDAQGLFKMVRQENIKFTRINGYNAFAT